MSERYRPVSSWLPAVVPFLRPAKALPWPNRNEPKRKLLTA
jgi:hypothetical protein